MEIRTNGVPTLVLSWYIVAAAGITTPKGVAVPVGSMLFLPDNHKIEGRLLVADGRWCQCADEPALFIALGATYGYDSKTESFKLPDLRDGRDVTFN
jgi:hypothetical protein